LKLARAQTTSNGVRTLMFWSPPRKIREGSASHSLPSEQDVSLSVCVHLCKTAIPQSGIALQRHIDVACSTQLSKSYLIPLGRDPHYLGQARLIFRRYSSGDFHRRAIAQYTLRILDCQGAREINSRTSSPRSERGNLAA